jgi:phage/plasmid-like protein (TIGR03299 family)
MSHEIDMTTGEAAVFTTGQPPWHKLGKVIKEAANSEEAIKLAGLDWEVAQRNIKTSWGNGEALPIATHVANVRTDTNGVLGVVSRGYRVFQNRQAFDFMDNLVGEKLCIYETAGALKEGRRVWLLARIPQEFRVQDDLILPYVLLTNSHDGSMALRMIPTTVRVVCQNTLNLALARSGRADGIRIYHSESLEARVSEARQKLGIITKRLDRFGEEIQALARKQMSQDELTRYFVQLAKGKSEKRQKVMLQSFLENFENERNNLPGIRGSLWAAYNAASEWADHQSRVRGRTQSDRASARLNSVWFGCANNLKQEAFEAALQMAS